MLCCFVSTSFAAEYDTSIPSYVPYSGGAFFEVFDSNLGQVSCVFPLDFLDGTFGFNSAGTDIYNLTNSTVNGYVVTSGGAVYTARANRFSYIEYRLNNTTSQYTALDPNLNAITATNINFVTDDPKLFNDSYFNRDNYIMTMLTLLAVFEGAGVLISLLRRGHKY